MARSASHPRTLLVALAFVAFISLGLPDTVLGVAWPFVRHDLAQPLDRLGWLFACGTSGYLISSFLAGQALRRMGVGMLLAASCGLVTLALTGNAAAPAFALMLAMAFIGGLGAGAIDAGLNVYASSHFSTRTVNWLHACWGVGASISPALFTVVLTNGGSWRLGYALLACVLGSLALLFIYTNKLWTDDATSSSEPTHASVPVSAALRHPTVWLHVAIYVVYGAVESTAGSLLFTLLTESRGWPVALAGATVSAYWASLTIGRFAFGQWSTKLTPAAVLWIATLLAPVAALTLLWSLPAWATIAGAALLGFVLAPIFPTYIAVTPARLGKGIAAHAVGFQVGACSVGIMIGPWSVAALARTQGLHWIAICVAIGAVALTVLHALATRSALKRTAMA